VGQKRVKSNAELRLIQAGLKAKILRKQLAVTWLASQQIIDAMRALREGIVIPDKTDKLKITHTTIVLPQPDHKSESD